MEMFHLRRKVYVDVVAKFDTYGKIKPLSLTWEDGTVFEIDKVMDCRPAASLKAGGQGLRFTCRILNNQTYLFMDANKWFVLCKDLHKTNNV